MWCATASFSIIGPYFFENENGGAVTINAEHLFASMTEETETTLENVFSIGWYHHTHCSCVYAGGSRYVPCRKSHFPFWRHPVAPKITWFEYLQLFLVGVLKITYMHYALKTPRIDRTEGGNYWRSGISRWRDDPSDSTRTGKLHFRRMDTTYLPDVIFHIWYACISNDGM